MGQHKHPQGSGAPSDGGHDYFAGRRQPQAAMAVSTLLVYRMSIGSMITLALVLVACLVRWQINSHKKCDSQCRMSGKTVLVTGGTSGVGRATATDLARRGATVVIAARDAEKGRDVMTEIRTVTANTDVHFEIVDLASLKSVKKFVNAFMNHFGAPDVIINSAAYCGPQEITEDQYERTFQVNHLGHFLLTHLLADQRHVTSSDPLRVITLTCDSYLNGDLSSPMVEAPLVKDLDLDEAYANSKLANLLFSYELARRYKDKNVVSVAVYPGSVRSALLKHIPGLYGYFLRLMGWLLYRPPHIGAQTVIHCAVTPDIAKDNGKLFVDCRALDLKETKEEARWAPRLWEKSVGMCAGFESEA